MTSSRSSLRLNFDSGRTSPGSSPSRLSIRNGGRSSHARTSSTESVMGSGAKLMRSNTIGGGLGPVAVNVAVRVRPPIDLSAVVDGETIPSKAKNSIVESIGPTNISVSSNIFGGTQTTSISGSKKFIFDRVFDDNTQQIGIFDHIKDSIPALIKGYNVSIMAYGQSGSGKSYTMGTADGQFDENTKGIVSRASKALFEQLNGISISDISSRDSSRSDSRASSNGTDIGSHGKSTSPWAVTVTYLEIYNEQVRDLLNGTGSNSNTNISIREDVKGNIIVNGLREIVVENVNQLLEKLNQGSSIRQTNSTAINSQSSRSHAIFTIHLTQRQTNPETGIVTTITSKLNFVDLAGSERLKNTKASDGRVKEGISINSGLTSLGKVISQLSLRPGGAHISYRDSKLTRVLQDSLGGKALTFLIACITTESFYLNETIGTLSYAQRARSIQLTPEIQQSQSKEDMLLTIEHLQMEVLYWKNRVESVGNISSSIRSPSPARSLFEQRSNSPFSGIAYNFPPPLTPNINLSTPNLPSTSTPSSIPISFIPKYTPRLSEKSSSSLIASPLFDQKERIVPSPLAASPQFDQKERILRSEAFQQNVNTVIEDYEKTISSLQESISEIRNYNSQLISQLETKDRESSHIEDLNRYISILEQKLEAQSELLEEYELKPVTNADQDTHSPTISPASLIKSFQDQINDLKTEVENHRKEQKRHLSESQYLTMQYNNARNEITKLTSELEELRLIIQHPLDAPSGNTSGNTSANTSASDLLEPKTPNQQPTTPTDDALSSLNPSKRFRLPITSFF